MSKLNQFDAVAPYYDLLARTVFGNQIQAAQEHNLSCIKDGDKILILGGGTGWILRALKNTYQLKVWYVEASSTMLRLARATTNDLGSHEITFIHGTESDVPPEEKFDIIILNFFLDLYPTNEIVGLMRKLTPALAAEGQLLVTDFLATKR